MHRRASHRRALPVSIRSDAQAALELPHEEQLGEFALRVRRARAVGSAGEGEIVESQPRAELVEFAADEDDTRGGFRGAGETQRGHELEGEEDRGEVIGAVVLLVAVFRVRVGAGHVEDAGVVDEAVQGLGLGDERGGEGADGIERVEVEVHHLAVEGGRALGGGLAPSRDEGLAAGDGAAGEDDASAETREGLRGGGAYAARRARHHEGLAGDVGAAHVLGTRRKVARVPALQHHVVHHVDPCPKTHCGARVELRRRGRGRARCGSMWPAVAVEEHATSVAANLDSSLGTAEDPPVPSQQQTVTAFAFSPSRVLTGVGQRPTRARAPPPRCPTRTRVSPSSTARRGTISPGAQRVAPASV